MFSISSNFSDLPFATSEHSTNCAHFNNKQTNTLIYTTIETGRLSVMEAVSVMAGAARKANLNWKL